MLYSFPITLYTARGYAHPNPKERVQPFKVQQYNIHLQIESHLLTEIGFPYNTVKVKRGQGYRIYLIPLETPAEYSLVAGWVAADVNPHFQHRALSLMKDGKVRSQWMFLLEYRFPLYRPGGTKPIRFTAEAKVMAQGVIHFALPDYVKREYLAGRCGPMENTYLGKK